MHHLKNLLHKRSGKSPPDSDSGAGSAGGEFAVPAAPAAEKQKKEPNKSEDAAEDEDVKPRKAKKSKKTRSKVVEDTDEAEKDDKSSHKRHSRTHERAHSALHVVEPANGGQSPDESKHADAQPVSAETTSSSAEVDADALAAAGVKLPGSNSDKPIAQMVSERRGRNRSGAFYDLDLPLIACNGAVRFAVEDMPSPTTSLKVTTGATGLPEGTTWSLRFSIGVADTIGRRVKMEDSFSVMGQFGGMPMRDMFLLCDGHNGVEAAQTTCKELPKALIKRLGDNPGSCEDALRAAFADTDKYLSTEKVPGGTTATVVLMDVDAAYVASVGDTRAVLVKGTEPKPLTVDHRPSNAAEAEAVVARGGTVSTVGNELRVNKLLAITRALGDPELSGVISAVPDVSRFSFDFEPNSTLVIACDGLWDYLSFVLLVFMLSCVALFISSLLFLQ